MVVKCLLEVAFRTRLHKLNGNTFGRQGVCHRLRVGRTVSQLQYAQGIFYRPIHGHPAPQDSWTLTNKQSTRVGGAWGIRDEWVMRIVTFPESLSLM